MANLTIEESLASKNNEHWTHTNDLYIGKLNQNSHFLSTNVVSKAFVSQICMYLDTCAKSAP